MGWFTEWRERRAVQASLREDRAAELDGERDDGPGRHRAAAKDARRAYVDGRNTFVTVARVPVWSLSEGSAEDGAADVIEAVERNGFWLEHVSSIFHHREHYRTDLLVLTLVFRRRAVSSPSLAEGSVTDPPEFWTQGVDNFSDPR